MKTWWRFILGFNNHNNFEGIIKDDKIVIKCRTHEKARNLWKLLIRTLQEKGSSGGPGRRLEVDMEVPAVKARIRLNWRKPFQWKMFTKTVMGMSFFLFFSKISILAMGPHSASHSAGTGSSFPGDNVAGAWSWCYLHLMRRLGISRAIFLLPVWDVVVKKGQFCLKVWKRMF